MQRVTLERPLPYPIAPDVCRAAFYRRPATTEEVGVEGLTFSFKWELYAGHHLVRNDVANIFHAGLQSWKGGMTRPGPFSGKGV